MSSKGLHILFVLGVVSMLAACSGDSNAQQDDGGACGANGELVQLSNQTLCAYKQAIVIETGFACPAAYPNRQDADRFSVCSQQVGGLEPEEIEEVRDVLSNEKMWDVMSPMPTLDLGEQDMAPDLDEQEDMTRDTGDRVDVLMMLDNSFSMCQVQQDLRDNLSDLLTPLLDKDFHIAVTTTHAPESGASIEPVAKESQIQSTPQPVPGNNQSCTRGSDAGNIFAPLRESLSVAVECLADSNLASNYTWSDAQIECALDSLSGQNQSGCVSATGLPDNNGDSRSDVFDLFPESSLYRAIPKVIRRADYEVNGSVDSGRLLADLKCAVSVGTRGDGYEKGLRAAVNALSPALLGGAVGSAGADVSAPNHGLIRQDAKFSLVMISDENDCSHDGTLQELGNACGANICEYMNSTAVSEGDSALISPEVFAMQLRENLQLAKGVAVNEQDIFIAGIHGPSNRSSEPFPDCNAGVAPDVTEACNSTAFGGAFSGDRYVRFEQDFARHYPLEGTVGAICKSSLQSTLGEIGAEIAK